MKLSPILISAVSANSKVERSASTVCDLNESGIFQLLSNGKYNFVPEYKIKFGTKDPGTGNKLTNKGKLAKAKGQFTHRNTGEGFSDGWVACTKNKMSAQYIQCFSDGTFTIDGKSGKDIKLPECTEIGCDTTDLGIFDREYTKKDGCMKGYTDTGLEMHKNQCFRTCGENNSALQNVTKRKVRCVCDFSERTCEYKIKVPEAGWVDWDGVNENGELHMPLPEDCEDEPKTTESTTPEPTPEPTTPEPTGPQWSQWGDWKPCSIKCSVGNKKGTKRRFRSCESDTELCTGVDTESEECEAPDGDCGDVCPFPIGHFQQSYDDRCEATFVQANGGLHIQHNDRCKFINCDSKSTQWMEFNQWICNCKANGVCRWKTGGSIQPLEFLDPVVQCAGLQGGRDGNEKSWAWVDGRRSLSTLANEVTDWDLHDICYDPTFESGVYFDAETWSLDEIAGARTYGRVVELDDGILACQHRKGSNIFDNRTIYVQLATKPGATTWASSERFFMFSRSKGYGAPTKPDQAHKGEYWESEMIFPGNNGPQNSCKKCGGSPGILLSERQNQKYFWPYEHYESGKLPAHPALCRVEKDGQWYVGAVSYATGSSAARDIFCTAYDDDGNAITGKNHNRHLRPESGDDNTKSEYFVIGSEDGSKWTEWSEWSSCGATCGPNARRIKTRQCLDSSGAVIDWKTGYNCLPDWESDETTNDDTDIVEVSTTRRMLCDFEEYTNKDECPTWGAFTGWSHCSQSCGLGGRSTRTRQCLCKQQTFNGEDVWKRVLCDDLPDDNPFKTENMCGDPSLATETKACHEDRVCAKSDGIGPGCLSDTYSFNTNQMRCFKTNCLNLGWCQHVGPSVYHNEFGLVPHLYTCYADTFNTNFAHTCSSDLGFDRQVLTRDKTSTCECHQGKCEWGMFETPDVKRQDCTVNYEWLSLPIQTDHPFYDQIVDFTNPSKTGSDLTRAIAARHIYDNGVGGCMVGKFMIGRRLPETASIIPDNNGSLSQSGEQERTFVLSAQCKAGGAIKWIDGPYTCTGSSCLREYIQIDRTNHLRDWTLCGLSRSYGFKTSGYMNSGIELDRLGLCRIGSDEEGWNIGTIIRYRQNDSDGTRPVKCCLRNTDWSAHSTPGCAMNDGMDYSNLPYQMLWAGDCQ